MNIGFLHVISNNVTQFLLLLCLLNDLLIHLLSLFILC